MGPLLWGKDYKLYYPGSPDAPVTIDYYKSEYHGSTTDISETSGGEHVDKVDTVKIAPSEHKAADVDGIQKSEPVENEASNEKRRTTPHAKELTMINSLPWAHPRRIYATVKVVLMHGINKDVIAHQSRGLEDVHKRAIVYENKVEHLWTTAQVCSAMIMSISHGANDVSNAIGPFTTEYETWSSGVTSAKTETPLWIKAVGGLGLGFGFWTFGYHIMRNLGNKITKHTPTRGYSMELAAAITVLLASRLALPVSTTQCITGAIIGVALTNGDLKSINWKQLGKIFIGWVLTVPSAGLISGIIMGMALNVPHWGPRP